MGIRDRDCCCGCGWLSVLLHTVGVYLSWELLTCHPESLVTLFAFIAALFSIAVNMMFLVLFNYAEASASTTTEVIVTLGRYFWGSSAITEVVLLMSAVATPCIYLDYPQQAIICGVLASVSVIAAMVTYCVTTSIVKKINKEHFSKLPV